MKNPFKVDILNPEEQHSDKKEVESGFGSIASYETV